MAVETLPNNLPFTMRQFLVIISVTVFSLIFALPIFSPLSNQENEEEEEQATSLYALLGTPQVRPAAINEKQMGEQYLAAKEPEVVTTQEITEENFDDNIALPRDFFIVQNAPGKLPESTVPDQEVPVLLKDKDAELEISLTEAPGLTKEQLQETAISQVHELTELASRLEPKTKAPVSQLLPKFEADSKTQEAESLRTPEPQITETAAAAEKIKPQLPIIPRPKGTWYALEVKKGQSLSEIFNELSLPPATLRRLKKVAKGRELALKQGDELHLLVDEHNILMELVKPQPQDKQVRFTRMSGKNDFTVVHEKLNAHVADPQEISGFLNAYNMPSALKAAQRSAKEEALKASQPTQSSQQDREEAFNLAYINRPQLLIGTIEQGENFKKAAKRLGLDDIAITEIQHAVLTKVNLSRLRAHDTLRVLFSGRGATSHVEALEIDSQIYGKVTVYKHPQNNNFYAENEFHPTSGVFRRFPITGQIKISSPFNPRRVHPILHQVAPHNGVDFKVPIGTPIYSPADGVVTFAGYVRGGGYTVIIKHFNDYATVYMHLSKFDVKNGQKIKAGQIIAKSGNTGRSTGPHLHYEIRINDHPVDPLKVDLPNNRTPKLAQAEKIAFDNNVRSLKAQLYKK